MWGGFLPAYAVALNLFKLVFVFGLTWMHMVKKYFLGCKVDQQLFNKVNSHVEQNSTLIRKAVVQYFREKEPNETISGYDTRLIDLLNQQVQDLQKDKQFLESKCEFYHVQSMGFFRRRSYLKQVKRLPAPVPVDK